VIRIALPAVIVLVTVAAFVGQAARNRAGEPRLTITLTERELRLDRWGAAGDEAVSVNLRFDVAHRTDPLDARNWISDMRLREIGFDLDVPAGAPAAAEFYDHVPPRRAWVVLEYDGPAWRALQRRRALSPDGSSRFDSSSRLVPVDVGADPEALARRHPGHLVLPAIIGVAYLPPAQGGPLVYGVLYRLVPAELSVPRQLRAVFTGLDARSGDASPEPRYEVDIAIGQLGLPYVRGARLRPADGAGSP
jgi:hypothetical protein